jgi:hypothetical protein
VLEVKIHASVNAISVKSPPFRIWTIYVAIQNTCQKTPPLLTAPKPGMLVHNTYILYVNLELLKYASGDHSIKIIFKYIKINGSEHIIKYERQ